jgi:hypothetical protein
MQRAKGQDRERHGHEICGELDLEVREAGDGALAVVETVGGFGGEGPWRFVAGAGVYGA